MATVVIQDHIPVGIIGRVYPAPPLGSTDGGGGVGSAIWHSPSTALTMLSGGAVAKFTLLQHSTHHCPHHQYITTTHTHSCCCCVPQRQRKLKSKQQDKIETKTLLVSNIPLNSFTPILTELSPTCNDTADTVCNQYRQSVWVSLAGSAHLAVDSNQISGKLPQTWSTKET